ncbi:MAG: pilin [Patescibacteria group bacterium]
MKKILSIFAAVSLLAVLVLPAVSLGADVPAGGEIPEGCIMSNDVTSVGCPKSGDPCGPDVTAAGGTVALGCGKANLLGICCMLNTTYTVTNWVFYIMTLIAVLMIVFGGFTYITAAGDPAKAGKGKIILTYAIIGLAIALIAKLIPSLVRFILGV